jgi:hypothetical protein
MVRQPGIEKMVVSSSPQTDVIGYIRLKFLSIHTFFYYGTPSGIG